MATPTTLRVRARGTAKCIDRQAIEASPSRNCFLGWRLIVVEKRGDDPKRPGFSLDRVAHEKLDQDITVPYDSHYIRDIVDGDLWPADEETAEACREMAESKGRIVTFDPEFGGEYHDHAKKKAADLAEAKAAIAAQDAVVKAAQQKTTPFKAGDSAGAASAPQKG